MDSDKEIFDSNQEKIKVTFTCTREVAAEIHSAITLYSGLTQDVEDDRENEEDIIKNLVKVGEKIFRSARMNKEIGK